ncbi:phosphatase PAP2 family protein [Chryseobacterium sp.]|uniref:phosphatase PAP2 family protein n=1 Tax=Chryseobacterium sp. TaxID=1871047 RepID=UPI0011CA4E18|nr:phosphatase PAP2 family protein [Chryseobacterium sp.]TXF79552.1 ABC transporter permease [Chryseobacterium sp.]
MFKTTAPVVTGISKFISNFFNPLTSLLIYFLYFSTENYSLSEASGRFLPILLLTVSPISFWIFWNVKKGHYSNMDVSNRNQRKSLYFFIAGAMIAYLLFDYFKNETLDIVMFFLLILLLILQLSNYFIKSSMHTAFNVFVAALFFSENTMFGIIWLGIAVLVGITRIILKRHTPREVLTGFAIAGLVSFAYLYAYIQVQH